MKNVDVLGQLRKVIATGGYIEVDGKLYRNQRTE
jgi:hypothetical protein